MFFPRIGSKNSGTFWFLEEKSLFPTMLRGFKTNAFTEKNKIKGYTAIVFIDLAFTGTRSKLTLFDFRKYVYSKVL